MIVAPGPWRIEITCPDAETIGPGRFLLDPVTARRNSQSLAHHYAAQIAACNPAGGQQASKLIGVFGLTVGGAGPQQLGHTIARCLSAGAAICHAAVLRQFGRIHTQQADTILPQAEAVAIAGPCGPGDRRRRAIERRREHGGQSKYGNGEDRAARAAKDGIGSDLSKQDFTAR
jgi:hypothetical protein